MGPGEAISLLGVCAMLISVAGMAFATYSKRLAFKQRKLELEAEVRLGGGVAPDMVARLEDRVRVLERIATDRGQDVAHQIEALRDARRTEALLDAREAEVR